MHDHAASIAWDVTVTGEWASPPQGAWNTWPGSARPHSDGDRPVKEEGNETKEMTYIRGCHWTSEQ